MGWIKEKILNWLQIIPSQPQALSVTEGINRDTADALYRIWYKGDPDELEQAYTQLNTAGAVSTMFWAAKCGKEKIRKIHSGLPAVIVDSLAYVVKSDLAEPNFISENDKSDWEAIAKENDFRRLIGQVIAGVLVAGDGVIKVSVDTDISDYPILEFISGGQVDYICKRGRPYGFDIRSAYQVNKTTYVLIEHYRRNAVTYELRDEKGNTLPLDRVPELADLKPVRFDGDYVMAVPVVFWEHPRHRGRGKSIFEGKTGVFDAHDEVVSQWLDALRAGRVVKYIPLNMLPRNPQTGEVMPPDDFGSRYVMTESPLVEGQNQKIEVVQPEIRYEAFVESYAATLNMCLQGLLSPATLGIEVGRMSSAEAQRERKDVTGNSRNTITEALELMIPQLIQVTLKTYDNMRNTDVREPEVSISFGEYGAPDFDTRVNTIGAAAAASIMSVEAQVEELWGNSKDETWKEEEVMRIKRERGLQEEIEPFVGGELA